MSDNSATEVDATDRWPPVTAYVVPDGPKMLAETLAVAQTYIGISDDPRRREHIARLGRLLAECERHRPTGPDGKHGERHTHTCGCPDKLSPGLEAAIDAAYAAGSIFSEANRDPVDHVSVGEDEHGVYVEDQAGSPDTMAELSVTGEAMCTVRLADLQAAVAVLEAINPFQHRESERWLDRLKDEL